MGEPKGEFITWNDHVAALKTARNELPDVGSWSQEIKRGEVMGDYLEGYVQALTNVLDLIEVEKCETVSDVRRMIRQMIDDEGSE